MDKFWIPKLRVVWPLPSHNQEMALATCSVVWLLWNIDYGTGTQFWNPTHQIVHILVPWNALMDYGKTLIWILLNRTHHFQAMFSENSCATPCLPTTNRKQMRRKIKHHISWITIRRYSHRFHAKRYMYEVQFGKWCFAVSASSSYL